ncbi:hypothetical protein QYF36_014147 [Acer negundo]|nr:hypothetical protein QYF36_014147 [Acer negundo]
MIVEFLPPGYWMEMWENLLVLGTLKFVFCEKDCEANGFWKSGYPNLGELLDWGIRFNIILGIARGLLYLHQDSSDTRMIMSFSGQAQYFKWNSLKVWALIWAEPRDRCSVYNSCGNFGSCNSNNKLMCKCLPGFEPSFQEKWNREDFSGGCSRKSKICGKNAEGDTFLRLNLMNVGNPDSQFNAKNETECKLECLNNCQCQAYSYRGVQITQRGVTGSSSACLIWSEDINNLQEEYQDGGSLFVRVAGSDIGMAIMEGRQGTKSARPDNI